MNGSPQRTCRPTARTSWRSAARPYQFFLAPVRAPDVIGYVALGFAVDDSLARRMRDLVGAEISLVSAARQDGAPFIASTLSGAERRSAFARVALQTVGRCTAYGWARRSTSAFRGNCLRARTLFRCWCSARCTR